MLLWPAMIALGFVVLTAVIIGLGTRSTARYEFKCNHAHSRVLEQAQPSTTPAQPDGRPAGGPPASGQVRHGARTPHPPGSAPAPAGKQHQEAVGVLAGPKGGGGAGRPAPAESRPAAIRRQHGAPTPPVAPAGPDGTGRLDGGPATGSATAAGWWLVVEPHGEDNVDGRAARAVAGPFGDRVDADWAALSSGLPTFAGARSVYGVRRPDGALLPRPLPQEQAWLAELGQQLDRLAEDWDGLLSDTDPLTTLVVEVAAALIEAGLALHDCDGPDPAGGVCLIPDPDSRGILASWRQHDRMSLQQVRGAAVDATVQQTMNVALANVLARLGFGVQPFGTTGCHLVTAVSR